MMREAPLWRMLGTFNLVIVAPSEMHPHQGFTALFCVFVASQISICLVFLGAGGLHLG